jgi:hypothetical protein
MRAHLVVPAERFCNEPGRKRMNRLMVLTASTAALLVAIASFPESAFALSVAGGGDWGTPGNNGPLLKLGPTSTQTCMLRGVSGDFFGNPGLWSNSGAFLPASAGVKEIDGFWWIETRAGAGTGVSANVICINATANRVTFSWSNNISSQGVAATPNRHCFLQKVWATSGLSGNVGALRTNLTIRKVPSGSGFRFDFSDSYVENVGGDTEFGGATAVCVDIVSTAHWDFTFAGPTNAANSATNTITLRDSFPNGTPVPVSNVVCFLTGIAGKWINPVPDPLGWLDGAILSNVSPNWRLTVTNGRQATVSCLR